jgi:hypothetical protein
MSEGHNATAVNNSTPEASNVTFYDGAPVVISAGTVVECGANPARIDGVAIGNSYNNTLGTAHPFALVDEGMIYEISIDKASAQGGALAVLAATTIGATYGITKDTIGSSPAGTPLYWYLDVDKNAANQRVLVVSFPVWSPPGTVNGRVLVKFLQAQVLQ